MARVKQVREKYTKEGEYYGITLPEFKHLKVTVETKVYTVKSNDEVIQHDENFSIRIDINGILKSELLKLNEALNAAVERTLYINRNEFFSYYTYDISKEEGIAKFNKILKTLTDFDNQYSAEELINLDEQNELIAMFKSGEVKDNFLSINYSEEKEKFYIVALDRVEMDEYRRLARNAQETDKVKFTFLDDIHPKLKNKTCFIYSKNDYDFIQKEVNKLIINKEKTIEANKDKISSSKDMYTALNYDKNNWAGFFIEFSEEEQGFYFYLKGYKQKSNYRSMYERFSSLENLVREMVVIQSKVDTLNIEDQVGKHPFKIRLNKPFESSVSNEIIPEVTIIKEKTKRLRWFVPIDSYPELKLIHDKYIQNEHFFTKKVHKQQLNSGSSDFCPTVSDLGNCYLYFSKDVSEPNNYIELSLPEFKDIRAILSEKDIYGENEKVWEHNLYNATKELFEPNTSMEHILSEAYRRAELKYTLETMGKPERLSKKKKI